jgi:predicted GH43/DUF377 family glycosyl hydrolase
MADLARRFENNPILRPADVKPSRDGLIVECLLNPGAFRYKGRTGLLLRVAERPQQTETKVSTPIIDPLEPSGIAILEFEKNDPSLIYTDPRAFTHNGRPYLTTLSHLRLAWSDDGVNFTVDEKPTLIGQGDLENFGMEDARVTEFEGQYHVTYTQCSASGIGVGYITTRDWKSFERHGMIFPPTNKDSAIFPAKVGDNYVALHRPAAIYLGGPYMWVSFSKDLIHWGQHACIAHTRLGMWDEQRIGAGAAPIWTPEGWLEIYHGADDKSRYCLGALLLDLADPTKVIARSHDPIMEPIAPYEQTGFFGNVVFTNGHVVDGDTITMYYGASDEIVCGATMSISEVLGSLKAS